MTKVLFSCQVNALYVALLPGPGNELLDGHVVFDMAGQLTELPYSQREGGGGGGVNQHRYRHFFNKGVQTQLYGYRYQITSRSRNIDWSETAHAL